MKKIIFSFLLTTALLFTSCYSVFSGGTGGMVVDADSTSTPKAGIANVDVYAYLDSDERDEDFDSWTEGTTFAPSVDYYGHTTTGNDGSFTISKLVWKESKPDFGKDADFTNVYLLFYHENYGLTKSDTVIVSDSSSDTVYVELTPIRKTTVLNINIVDVSNGANTTNTVYVQIEVPQTSAANPKATSKVYDATITGNGIISVTYPRWATAEDKAKNIENTPSVKISYVQSGDEITWKACYNGDNAAKNYAFREASDLEIVKVIKNSSYSLNLYGKSSKLNVPVVSGQISPADDGKIISMKQKDSSGSYSIDLGQVTTVSQTIGTSGTEKHGTFSGLGRGYSWWDNAYTEKFSTVDVEISVDGTVKKQMPLRSDVPTYNVQL